MALEKIQAWTHCLSVSKSKIDRQCVCVCSQEHGTGGARERKVLYAPKGPGAASEREVPTRSPAGSAAGPPFEAVGWPAPVLPGLAAMWPRQVRATQSGMVCTFGNMELRASCSPHLATQN